MPANCVNPSCEAPLHSFSASGGRFFQFDVVSISVSATDSTLAPFDEKPQTQTAQFWLCGRCAPTLKLVLDPMTGLKLVPQGSQSREISASGEAIGEATNC